ncbi:MAG: DUF2142 domain-containing protein, partial [Clostridiales bacterium]|nr:DUF2142 domain-containing protein [Clostridiales bacterium]
MCRNVRNKISGKSKIDYIVVAFVIAIVLLTIVRIFSNRTTNRVFGISGLSDGSVQMIDARYLELELDAPMSGVTGFGFQFEGDRENFEGARFWVSASIQNDSLNPLILFEKEMPLIEQAYDYQNECYKVIVPFEGDIQQGNHLRIAIMGMGISEEDGIFIKTSSQFGAGATFEINDFVQDNILAGNFYYQTKELNIFPALIQGIIFILLIILAGEIWKKPRRKRKPEVKSQKLPIRKRIRSIVPVIILLVIALDYTYYAGIRTQIQAIKPKDNVQIYQGENAAYRKLCDGEAAFLECSAEENNFGGFGISLKEPYDDNGILTIEVNDLESQKLVASTKRAVYELKEDKGGFLKFDFDSPVKKSEGKEYIVSIYYSGSEPIEMLMADGINNPRLIPLYQENIFLNVLFIILSIFIIVFTLVIALCEQKGMKLEKFFLIAVVFLGILFQMVITPFAVPDEAAHIDTAYRLSNQILGVEDSKIKDAIYKRECDIWTDSGIKRTIDVESYRWIYEDWFSTEGNNSTRLIFAADVTPNANILYFLPAAIGITVGRILGIGFLPTIFLARTFNLLLAAWMIYQAVKKLPFGKSILCAVALLPLTIQEIASCSYDALIIAVSILYVSYCVFAIYSRKNLERADILVIVITAIMLGICKGGVYTPLYLLGIWILVKRGYIRLPQRKGAKVAGIAVAACLALGGIIG